MRRSIIFVLSISLALLAAAPASADREARPEILAKETATVVAGDTVWVAVNWRASGDLRDFRVTVDKPRGVEISYPTNTGDHSGPMQSTDLMDGEIDFTSLKVSVPYLEVSRSRRSIPVQLTASWLEGDKDGRDRERQMFTVYIPLTNHNGDDAAQVTDAVKVPAGGGAWVEVRYTGFAPELDRFAVVVRDSDGLDVTYPNYGSSTSLHHDAILEDGETDVVRFYIDAADATPGSYDLTLEARYAKGSKRGALKGSLALDITP